MRIIEIPLNSPDPLLSIARLRQSLPQDCRVGAGTVMSDSDVRSVKQHQGEIIISPHTDPAIIQETRKQGLISLPGAATPSEAFSALSHGAHGIKIFPAEAASPLTLKAWRAVIPAEIPCCQSAGSLPNPYPAGWRPAPAVLALEACSINPACRLRASESAPPLLCGPGEIRRITK
ncbi:hypothetical protein [Brenneria izadpanahii]|uniref:hypothetical protein n=1 Tax=Brenneria izadpanahii TaxID=2722756 RepID=UPI001FE89F10|nr:hypothetical protein [Brenneria izadpanahii]